MRLWTIQHIKAYEDMVVTGSLRASSAHLFLREDFLFAYDWMSEQLKKRIGPPPDSVVYPVWAWYQWDGRHQRPDMRSFRKWCTPGTPIVLLTVEIPDDQVLLSDFDMWNCILCNGYLSLTGDEPATLSPEDILASWENVFCWNIENDVWPSPKNTQACMWEVCKGWIRKAEFFSSR